MRGEWHWPRPSGKRSAPIICGPHLSPERTAPLPRSREPAPSPPSAIPGSGGSIRQSESNARSRPGGPRSRPSAPGFELQPETSLPRHRYAPPLDPVSRASVRTDAAREPHWNCMPTSSVFTLCSSGRAGYCSDCAPPTPPTPPPPGTFRPVISNGNRPRRVPCARRAKSSVSPSTSRTSGSSTSSTTGTAATAGPGCSSSSTSSPTPAPRPSANPTAAPPWSGGPTRRLPSPLVDYTAVALTGIAAGRTDTEMGWAAV